MARHELAPIPEGYTVIPVSGRFYPMVLTWEKGTILHARSFLRATTGRVLSYAKRSLAVNFLIAYHHGRASWASIDGQAQPTEKQYRQFLESVADNEEYAAYLEHSATPRAEDY